MPCSCHRHAASSPELGFGFDSELIGVDTRKRVRKTTTAPFRCVCNLEYDVPRVGRRSMCSGTLIGPRTVLTSGDCLAGLVASRMRVAPGRTGTLEPLPATGATRFVLFPGSAGSSSTDIGIIHLPDPIGNTVGYWTRSYSRSSRDPVGTSILAGPLPLPAGKLELNLSGYAADKPAGSKNGCTSSSSPTPAEDANP